MDMHNNAEGRSIVLPDGIGEPSFAAIQAALINKLRAGDLMIWDTDALEHQAPSLDVLFKSNDERYFPDEMILLKP